MGRAFDMRMVVLRERIEVPRRVFGLLRSSRVEEATLGVLTIDHIRHLRAKKSMHVPNHQRWRPFFNHGV